MTGSTVSNETKRFLRTGDYDLLFRNWPGRHALERIESGSVALQDALLAEVKRRQEAVNPQGPISIPGGDLVTFTRQKVEPMVRGLFIRKECEAVLALLERSVVFLTREQIEPQIRRASLETARTIANMYLGSIGAKRLGGNNQQHHVGLSEETSCYVSVEYFSEADPFADFVVHEAAHVFHNTKRSTAGLQQTRRRQWLLPIDFRKHETFAYACEAYSRILERAKRPAERQSLVSQLEKRPPPPSEHVEPKEFFSILAEAVSRRNGWKVILERCSSQNS